MDDELDIALSVLSLDDPESVNRAIQTIAASDPARAQQLQGRLNARREVLGLLSENNVNSALGSIGSGEFSTSDLTTGVPQLPKSLGDFLGRAGAAIGNTASRVGSGIADAAGTAAQFIDAVPNHLDAIRYLDQLATDVIDPEAGLRAGLRDQSRAQLESLDFNGNIEPSSGLTGFPDPFGPVAPPVLGTSQLDAALASVQPEAFAQGLPAVNNQLTQQQYNQILDARNALLIDSARQQAASQVSQENLMRLGEQLALQQVPQVNNTLGVAAQLGQTPSIGATPANGLQTLNLTQAVAPQVTIPSLQGAARTNINQRNRAERLDQSAQARLQREQVKALELAMQQFQTQVARPILSQRR